MLDYDNMPPGIFPPYSMLANPPSYSSNRINTDRFGLRKNVVDGKLISLEEYYGDKRVNLVVGASTAFGVGASNDSSTVSSLLSKTTGDVWLNVGIRGAVSIQEYITLIMHLNKFSKIDKIVFLSGINDLYRNLSDSKDVPYDKRFAYQNDQFTYASARRIALAYFKSFFTSKSVNQILDNNFSESELVDVFNYQFSLNKFYEIYKRNFRLYSAIAREFDVEIFFGLQPFYHKAKMNNKTKNEITAIERTEYLQKDTNWSIVKNRISESLDDVSIEISKLANLSNIEFIDFNTKFDTDFDYFVDSVHLTDKGNERIVEVLNEYFQKI